MAGRRPKSDTQKALQGTLRAGQQVRNAPKYLPLDVKPPDFLDADAAAEWRRVVSAYAGVGLFKSVDRAALAAYCVSWANWRKAEAIVQAEGPLIRLPIMNRRAEVVGYNVKRHPATVIATQERKEMRAFAGLFGFDPSNRTRVHADDAEDDLSLERFLASDEELPN